VGHNDPNAKCQQPRAQVIPVPRENKGTTTSLNLFYANARGIRGKLTSLKIALKETKTDIALLNETHLKPTEKINIPGYVTVTKNREGKGWGGLAILVKGDLASNVSIIQGPVEEEHIWARVDTQPPTFICCFYGKQECDPEDQVQAGMDALSRDINQLKQQGEIVILGDFNSKIGHPEGATSRNGHILEDLVNQNSLTIINTTAKCTGVWTRMDTSNPTKRSVLDYVLASPHIANQVKGMVIDEEHHIKLKGKTKKSDHNSITVRIEVPPPPKHPKPDTFKWRINDNTDWKAYEDECEKAFTHDTQITYEEWAGKVLLAAHKTIGSRKNSKSKRQGESTRTKQARKNKKAAKHKLNNHQGNNEAPSTSTRDQDPSCSREQAKEDYTRAKDELEESANQDEADRITKIIQKIADTGGVNSKTFWNMKRNTQKNGEDLTCFKKDNNEYVYQPEELKEYVAHYYEELYRNDTTRFGNSTHTEVIEQQITDLVQDRNHKQSPLNKPFIMDELESVISKLPKGKSAGPNRVCYELVTHGGHNLKTTLLTICNNIVDNEIIPQEWQHSSMVMLPKGKKDPERIENKRGISLADCTCKVFERLILNRIDPVLPFTEAQAGSRKGRSTTDQIFILKSVIEHRKARHLPTYLAFLDLHKAYDLIWKAAILNTLWEGGVRGKIWRIMRELNDNLTAMIDTRFGPTRSIEITGSIRQGGVLSGIEFAALVDRCETDLQNAGLGVNHGEDRIASLLLMDDIVLVAESAGQLQEMLEVLDNFAKEWHLTFSQTKSKVMIVKPSPPSTSNTITSRAPIGPNKWKLGELILKETDSYTYLGEVITSDSGFGPQLKHLRQKMYAHTNRILATGSDEVLSRIKMSTFLELHEKCLLPALLYNSETWILSANDINMLNTLQTQAFQKYMKTPNSTPKLAYYAELGIYPLYTQVQIRQLMYLHKLLNRTGRASEALHTESLSTGTQNPSRRPNQPKSWFNHITSMLNRYGLPTRFTTIEHIPKSRWKTMVEKSVKNQYNTEFYQAASASTKMTGIISTKQTPNRESYITTLGRKKASAIFRLRARCTRAETNQCRNTALPVCSRCENGLASDLHYFSECDMTRAERTIHGVSNLDMLYHPKPDLATLEKYASFAIEIGLVVNM
jgi:exonuclease III